jgi:predicted transcriptional regulator
MPTKPTYKVPVDDQTLGRRLQEIRRARGLTQVELGKKLSMSQGLISGYERGRLRMSAGVVVAFAKALKVSSDEILGLKNTRDNGHFDRQFVRRLRKMTKLSRRDKKALVMMIDAFINKIPDDDD